MNKEKIIKDSETFSTIIKSNHAVKSKYFSIYFQKDSNTLYGITIPKKVGKAHIRNKIKRQIKNIIITNEKDIQKHFSYVIIIKEAILDLSYQEMEFELIKQIKKVRD